MPKFNIYIGRDHSSREVNAKDISINSELLIFMLLIGRSHSLPVRETTILTLFLILL